MRKILRKKRKNQIVLVKLIAVREVDIDDCFTGGTTGRGSDTIQPLKFRQFVIHPLQLVDTVFQIIRHFAKLFNSPNVFHKDPLLKRIF